MSCRSRSKPRSARLALEVLEDRITPAQRIWDGGATASNNWTNANNWAGNVAPAAGDDLVFPSNVSDKTSDNNFPTGTLFNSITLGGGHTLRGARVLLGAGGVSSSGSSNQVNNDIDLGAFSNTVPRVFLVNAGSTLFLDGQVSGLKDVHKTGTGNLSFRGNNTYTGFTDVKAGTLFVEKDESLGGLNRGTTVRAGATLLFNDTGLGAIRSDEAITVEGGGTVRAINDVELRGEITTLGAANFRHQGSALEKLDISARITGPGGITIQDDTGRVRLSGSTFNDYAGPTTVSGELKLDKSTGNAIPGDLTIDSGGVAEANNNGVAFDNQIDRDADVVVNANGRLEFGLDVGQQLGSLSLNGGEVEGTLSEVFSSRLFISNHLTATSTSASAPARISNTHLAVVAVSVLDGPAFNDLVADDVGLLSTEGSDDRLTLSGGGTMFHTAPLVDTLGPSEVVVDEGLYRISGVMDEYSVTVNDGGEFAGDGRIDTLTVNAGGRVRPGPLSSTGTLGVQVALVMNPGSVLEVTLEGTFSDQLDVAGTVLIEPGAILEPTAGPGAAVGLDYRIINNQGDDSIFGQFTAPEFIQPTGQRLLVDYASGSSDNDVKLTLLNTAPRAPDLALDRTEVSEGGSVIATGSLVDPDPGDDLRLIVNWGDGTPEVTLQPGLDSFALRHTYRDDGEYRPRFAWLDQHDEGNGAEFVVTVNPSVPALASLRITRGSDLVTLSGQVIDAGRDSFTLVVHWGDGEQETHHFERDVKRFKLSHRYGDLRRYDVRLEVTDDDGGQDVEALLVLLAPRRRPRDPFTQPL